MTLHSSRARSPRGKHLTVAAVIIASAFLVSMLASTSANHNQSATVGATTVNMTFDHDGDNEWWVEVLVKDAGGDSAVTVEARAEKSTYHHLQQKSISNGWNKWGTNSQDQVRVPPGERVQFRALVIDAATGNGAYIESCFFTHPAGVEQCGANPLPGTFDATFTGVRGNEWWVQAKVATNGPSIGKVDGSLDQGATWKPMEKKSWGWAMSTRIVDGTIVRLRATATDGQTDLSSCRRWIPPTNQDAQIVDCQSTQGFDATFSNVKGNQWWVEAKITANRPIHGVFVYWNDCSQEPADMTYRSDWNKWVLGNTFFETGTKLVFEAYGEGGSERGGGYIWTQATPTSGCPEAPAWPKRGTSYVDYFVDIGGGSKDIMDVHFAYDANGVWQVTCEVDHFDENTGLTTQETVRASFPPPLGPTTVIFGEDHEIGTIGFCSPDDFGVRPDKSGTYTVRQNGTTVQAMTLEGGWDCGCYYAWSQNTGLTFSWDVVGQTFHSVGRMKDTDAPLRTATA